MSAPIYEDPQACHVHYQNMSSSARSFSPDSSRAQEILAYAKREGEIKLLIRKVKWLLRLVYPILVMVFVVLGLTIYMVIAHHVPSRVVIKEEVLGDLVVTSDTPRPYPSMKSQCDYILDAISVRLSGPVNEIKSQLHHEIRDISSEIRLLLLSQITELSLMTEQNSTFKYFRGPGSLKESSIEDMTRNLHQLINDLNDINQKRSLRTGKHRMSRATPNVYATTPLTIRQPNTPHVSRLHQIPSGPIFHRYRYNKETDME
nr:putative TM protein [Paramyxoviridae sp.]